MRAWIVVIVMTLAIDAAADGAEDVALAHLDRGVAAYRSNDFKRALRELTAAQELAPDKPNPYRWLALTEIQLGDCQNALVHIDGFLTRVQSDDPRVPEMTRWQAFCQRSVATPSRTSVPQRESRPSLTERWWFWPAVGVAALTLTGGIIYVATDTNEATLPSIHCGATGCKP